eukprot:1446788-Alexandrium_andersonii.AAC.1
MAESPRLLSLGALCRNNLYEFFWAPGAVAPILLTPREGAHQPRKAMQMQVEHSVPIIPAEFRDVDLLDAESEVVKFMLAFF